MGGKKINIVTIDQKILGFFKRNYLLVGRLSLFIVFFWFGVLKMMELSPSVGVVHTLYDHTFWFIPWKIFIVLFGAYECVIGIIFLFPGKEKWVLYLLIPHAITTFGPLIILPKLTWKGFLVPNLIGQYIIKNLVIISLAIFIAAFEAETNEMEKGLVNAHEDLMAAEEEPGV